MRTDEAINYATMTVPDRLEVAGGKPHAPSLVDLTFTTDENERNVPPAGTIHVTLYRRQAEQLVDMLNRRLAE